MKYEKCALKFISRGVYLTDLKHYMVNKLNSELSTFLCSIHLSMVFQLLMESFKNSCLKHLGMYPAIKG